MATGVLGCEALGSNENEKGVVMETEFHIEFAPETLWTIQLGSIDGNLLKFIGPQGDTFLTLTPDREVLVSGDLHSAALDFWDALDSIVRAYGWSIKEHPSAKGQE